MTSVLFGPTVDLDEGLNRVIAHVSSEVGGPSSGISTLLPFQLVLRNSRKEVLQLLL